MSRTNNQIHDKMLKKIPTSDLNEPRSNINPRFPPSTFTDPAEWLAIHHRNRSHKPQEHR